MKRKILAILLLACFLTSLSGCLIGSDSKAEADISPTPTPVIRSDGNKPIVPYDEIYQITWLRVAEERLQPSTLEYLLLNFGLKVTEINFSSQNMTTQIAKMFQSSIIPDLVTGISLTMAESLAAEGLLEDLALHADELSSYFALWNGKEASWEYTKSVIADGDSLYCIVPVNRTASKGWIYNKTFFESNNFEFPTTISELFDILKEYKRKNPNAVAWTNQNEAMQMTALLNAYGLTDDEWQTDADGNVIYLYAQKGWYESLEWMYKFKKEGLVPTDKSGNLKSLSATEYETYTKSNPQIVEYTDTYSYLYIQSMQSGYVEWAVADDMIAANDSVTPAMKANVPYISEATCISAKATEKKKAQLLAFLNWCCTDEGQMWTNFGKEGDGYEITEGIFSFLRYYSDEMTPDLKKEEVGSISDITIGRLLATTPWEKVSIAKHGDRYTAEEQFLSTANVRLVLPERFTKGENVLEDVTELYKYDKIQKTLRTLSQQFEESTKSGNFSDTLWNKYYASLVEAGLLEMQQYMQSRKI